MRLKAIEMFYYFTSTARLSTHNYIIFNTGLCFVVPFMKNRKRTLFNTM